MTSDLYPCKNNCGEMVRRVRESDGLDPLAQWTHRNGNPLCDVVLTAAPVFPEDRPGKPARIRYVSDCCDAPLIVRGDTGGSRAEVPHGPGAEYYVCSSCREPCTFSPSAHRTT